MRGKLIVIYGINNLGKSTQAKRLVQWLNEQGRKTEYLKYPLYELKPSGPMINAYLREGNPYNLSARESQLLNVVNRFSYQPALAEKLNSGVNIVAEDYKGTGMAWGIGAGVDQSFMEQINEGLLPEDLSLYFTGKRFLDGVEAGHKHETNDELTKKVAAAHEVLADKFDWLRINANQTPEQVFADCTKEIEKVL